MGSKTHKKHCWVTIILAIIGSVLTIAGTIYCILDVDRESAAILPIVGATVTFFPCLLCYLIEYRIRFRKEIAVANRARAIREAEAARREEEDSRIAEANAKIWAERWESSIKPILKFALVACVVLVVGGIIVSAASAFIGAFGMVAFLLLLILIFK